MNQRRLAGLAGVIALVLVAGVLVAVAGPSGSIGIGSTDDPPTVDIDDGEELDLKAHENSTVTGTLDGAAGTEVSVRLRSSGDSPYLKSDTATVDEDGRFEARFDLSHVENEHEATLVVMTESQEIERTITVLPAD